VIYLYEKSELYIPDGFPIEGNEKILELVNPILKYLILIDKVIICSIVNALTINIKPINDGHDYNSNFIVLPKGLGKTTLLNKFIHEGNDESVYLTPSKHFESQIMGWDRKVFEYKTWINFDAITLLNTLKPTQRAQLISFYTEILSDGYYHRDKTEAIEANMNVLFGMASESFYEFQQVLQDSTVFDRIVPIYFFPTSEQKERIRKQASINRTKHRQIKIEPIVLPYIGKLQYDFENDWVINSEVDKLAEQLENDTGLTGTRASRYVFNFICSNAYINGRKRGRLVHPDENDIKLFKWLMDIHYPLDSNSMEFMVYNVIKAEAGDPVTVDELSTLYMTEHFLKSTNERKSTDENYRKKKVRVALNMLERRGMILCEHRKGESLYWVEN